VRGAIAITASSLAGYTVFYLYFIAPLLGAAASALVLTASALVVAVRTRKAAEASFSAGRRSSRRSR